MYYSVFICIFALSNRKFKGNYILMKQPKVRKQIIDKIVDETLNNIRKPKRKLVEGVQYDSSKYI